MTLIQTSSGPMIESASPELLASLLDGFADRIVVAGVPLDEWLAPGVSEDKIRAELESVGLVAPDELVVWFGWHNGLSPAVTRKNSIHALPSFDPLSVAEAIEGYRRDVLDFKAPPSLPGRKPIPDEIFQFGVTEGWMRLSADAYGCAIECVPPSSQQPRLRSPDENFFDDSPKGFYQAVSLCTLVSWWIESLDSGAFRWNTKEARWAVDGDAVPESQRAIRFY